MGAAPMPRAAIRRAGFQPRSVGRGQHLTPMPWRTGQTWIPDPPQSGLFTPSPALLRPGPDREWRSSRRALVIVPMNDADQTSGSENSADLLQQGDGILD